MCPRKTKTFFLWRSDLRPRQEHRGLGYREPKRPRGTCAAVPAIIAGVEACAAQALARQGRLLQDDGAAIDHRGAPSAR